VASPADQRGHVHGPLVRALVALGAGHRWQSGTAAAGLILAAIIVTVWVGRGGTFGS
jgi:hypothetical protein